MTTRTQFMTREKPAISAWRGLITIQARVVAQIERDLAAAGCIPLAWYDVLLPLSRAEGQKLRLHELAEHAVLSRSGLTRLVDRLESEGLLRRESCPEDRRGYHAVLTATGEEALRRAWPVYRSGIENYFARYLSSAQISMLIATWAEIPPSR